jgi:hypothetical protein
MRKLIIINAIIGMCLFAFGQSEPSDTRTQAADHKVQPVMILKINKTEVTLDSLSIKKINPDWIEKIVVLKDDSSEKIYGNKEGVIIIYAKSNKWEKLREICGLS